MNSSLQNVTPRAGAMRRSRLSAEDNRALVDALRHLPPRLSVADVTQRLGTSKARALRVIQQARYLTQHRVVSATEWAHVNWMQSNAVIAQSLGVWRSCVLEYRKRMGLPMAKRILHIGPRRAQQFAELPKGLTNRQVAERLGYGLSSAASACRKYGYAPVNEYDRMCAQARERFRRLPAGLNASQISRTLNIGYITTIKWACQFGYRLTPDRKLSKRIIANRKMLRAKIRRLPKGLVLREVARRIGRSKINARRWCLEFGYEISG